MRVLFDQATPVPLRGSLTKHEVRTAAQEGWDRLQNGDLLTAAEAAEFDVFVTTDKNMRYQQTVTGRDIAVVLLTEQQWPVLKSTSGLLSPRWIKPYVEATRRLNSVPISLEASLRVLVSAAYNARAAQTLCCQGLNHASFAT